MKDRFLQMFTGKDNVTLDIGRIIWFETVQAYIAISIYALYKGGVFDAVTWGAGLAALLGAGGAALGLKASVEPSEALVVKTDKVTFKQALGRPLPSSGDDDPSDGSSADDEAPNSPGEDDSATTSASSTTTTQAPAK